MRAGRPPEAREIAERTIAFRRGPTLEEPPYEWPVLIDALAAAGDWSRLEAILPEARDRVGYVAWLEPAIDRAEGAMFAARGDHEASRARLGRALASYRRLGMEREASTTEAELARLPN